MVNLLKIHYQYLFTKKLISIILLFSLITLIASLLLSDFYISKEQLQLQSTYYHEEYLYEMVGIIKILIILFCTLLTIFTSALNHYDYLLLGSFSRKKVFTSRFIIQIIIMMTFTVLILLISGIIPLFLTTYFTLSKSLTLLFIKLLLFSVLYQSISLFIYQVSKHILPLFLLIALYMVIFLSSELNPALENVSLFHQLTNLILPDVISYEKVGFQFFYGNLFVIILTIQYFIVNITLYNYSDI